jgi:hypothetical protein
VPKDLGNVSASTSRNNLIRTGYKKAGMDQVYKGHKIQASAWLHGSGWKPSIVVTYRQGDKNILKNITIDQVFPTCETKLNKPVSPTCFDQALTASANQSAIY